VEADWIEKTSGENP